MVMSVPRQVVFKDNICVAAGLPCGLYGPEFQKEVIFLPTDNVDFIGYVNPVGMTREEIKNEVEKMVDKLPQV